MIAWIRIAVVAGIAGATGGMIVAFVADSTNWDSGTWTALAAWVTAGVAVAAGALAWSQLREARSLRLEQAQPYVVAYMEPSRVNPQIVDLVVRNFGATAAIDVRLLASPELRRSTGQGGESETVWHPDVIPLLVPGQEWRTMWDFSVTRKDTDLPDTYSATVTYRDHRHAPFSSPSVLDWGAFKGRRWVTVYGTHDAAKALREIQKTVKKWQESIHGGLAVYVRDGDSKDAKDREASEGARRRHEELLARLKPDPDGGDKAAE